MNSVNILKAYNAFASRPVKTSQHLRDIRHAIKTLSALRTPSRRQLDELAEWKQAEQAELSRLRGL